MGKPTDDIINYIQKLSRSDLETLALVSILRNHKNDEDIEELKGRLNKSEKNDLIEDKETDVVNIPVNLYA